VSRDGLARSGVRRNGRSGVAAMDCEGGSGWVGPGSCNGRALGSQEGMVLWEEGGTGRCGRKVALDGAKLRVGRKDRLKADRRRAKQRGHEPRHGE
jgi:hypothetical protein